MLIGIDPGTTVGFAALDLKGRVVGVGSFREQGYEKVVQEISKLGRPCIISCDVKKAPELVLRIAAKFNGKVFSPNYDLTESEKRKLVAGLRTSNMHELDALASARKAFHFFENKFRLVDRVARESDLESSADELKYYVLNGLSVKEAIEILSSACEEKELEKIGERREKSEPRKSPISEVVKLKERIGQLLRANFELRKAVERHESEKKLLEDEVKRREREGYLRIMKEREMRSLEMKVYRLEQFIRFLRQRRRRNRQEQKVSDLKSLGNELDIVEIIEEYRSSRK